MTMTCEEIDRPNEDPDLGKAEQLLLRKSPAFQRATGLCRWCKAPKSDQRSVAEYCSKEHRVLHHNYLKKQGAALVTIAKRWRRYKGKGDFSLFTRMLDDAIAEDRRLGLDYYPNPPAHAYARRVRPVKRP